MRTHSYVKQFIDGKNVATLDVYRDHNTFRAYIDDENVYDGSYSGLVDYINKWKDHERSIADGFHRLGLKVELTFEQTIA